MNRIETAYLPVLTILIASVFSAVPVAKAGNAGAPSSREIETLLENVKAEAATLEHDASDLAAWTRAKSISWQTHAAQLNKMRGHINQAGELLARMNQARLTASPWQRQAIDRIHPLLKELAENTAATVNHLNERRANINFSEYRDYAQAGEQLASELSQLVSDYVGFGENEADYHRLRNKLEVSAS